MKSFLLSALAVPGFLLWAGVPSAQALPLRAGAAKVDVTHRESGPVNDTLYVKALVLDDGTTRAVIITVDAVAIAEIGSIKDPYLATVRARLEQEHGIAPDKVLINASHCHGRVVADIADRTVKAVGLAVERLVPVRVGAGSGHENRIMENRRVELKGGGEADVRHAYSFVEDEVIVGIGPVDPEIGLLRLDRADNGRPLAVLFNFACHPIQGVPSGGNTADITGFASQVIEDNLGEGAVALFIQGCGGDINPIGYKAVDQPRDAEPLGNLLGLSALKGWRGIEVKEPEAFRVIRETLTLPRADLPKRIAELETEREKLMNALRGTSLNLKTFLPLVVKYELSPDTPLYPRSRYLQEEAMGREGLKRLDEENRRNIEAYRRNILTMERLTRLQTNLRLLKNHQAKKEAAQSDTLEVEVVGLRIGDFRLVSFPGELTVRIGLNLKKASPFEHTYVAGYSNGYIYYAATDEQLHNRGGAQEDSDSMLGVGWQKRFEDRALDILKRL